MLKEIEDKILDLVQKAYVQGWKDGERYNHIPQDKILAQDMKNREASGGAYRLLIKRDITKTL